MDEVFADLDSVNPYLDDIIVGSSSFAAHVMDVLRVVKRLNQWNLRISMRKLKLAHPEIIVIGNKISREGVTVAVEKLEKMEYWKGNPVKTLKQLQQRLGFTNYFREYVPNYASLMAPLEKLRTQGKNLKWMPEHDAILEKFRKILNEQVIISYPEFEKELIVGTDASKYGLGAILYQVEGVCGKKLEPEEILKSPKKYLRFASRALTPSECNYGAPQRELLGVLFALKSFRPYLFGNQFRLFTDHKALTYMLERPKVSSVIYNWLDEILQYNFKMEHVPGILNALPDKMSRIYDQDERKPIPVVVLAVFAKNELNSDLEDLEVVEDLELRSKIMGRAHMHGHFGAAEMARTIRSSTRTTWPNLVKDCQAVVSACHPCQSYNIGKMGYHPPKNLLALMPFDHISVDLKQMPLSTRGNSYYLLVIDIATRFVFLRELASKSTYSVAQQLLRLFCDVGFPKVLQSDNGTEFINQVMKALKALAGIDERLISPYHHRSNGIAERAIQSTSNSIYKALGGLISQWDDYLPGIQHAFNTRVIELHGSSPYSLVFGRSPNNFADYRYNELQPEEQVDRENRLLFLNTVVFPAVREKVSKTLSKRNEYFVKTHRMLKEDYPAGSQVMVRDELKTAKHQPKFEGPFTVLRRKASGNYELKGLDGTTYIRSPWVLKLVAPEILKDFRVPDTIYAAVDHIVEHREAPDGSIQYRVRWEKQGPELDSWPFEKDFVNYGPLQKYSKKFGKDKRTKKINGEISKKFPLSNEVSQKLREKSEKRVRFSEKSKDVEAGVIARTEELLPIEIDLPNDQRNALGDYWKTVNGKKRDRKSSIIESDSD